jgi:hypothetical protein
LLDVDATKPNSLLLRADGYHILIEANTAVTWDAPWTSLADVRPGGWIAYKGQARADGVVVAFTARLSPNVASKKETKAREEIERDMSAVPAAQQVNGVSMGYVVANNKLIDPYSDPAVQGRVATIGESLIPPFQRSLPDTDPTKIKFRFQVVDNKEWRGLTALPSGVILVPRKIVDRMQNDAQLAEVLALGVAFTLEKETYRMIAARYAVTALKDYSIAELSPAGFVLSEIGNSVIVQKEFEQSGRVSLGLLHDAGYDIDQAPIAWWLLAPKEPKPVAEVTMPPRATYLYRILGETWHNPAANATQAR